MDFRKKIYKNLNIEEGLSTTKISYEAGKQPKKAKRSGNGNYCCVPNGKNMQCKVGNKAKIKRVIGFFLFVKTPKEKRNGFKIYSDFGEEERKINLM